MPRKILVIDDEEATREVTQVTLENFTGWMVCTACSGKEGIARALSDRPDAILLDVMMPDVDGPQTLKELRSTPATCEIPVIFFTAKAQAAEIRRLRSLGAKAVIPKPFDPMTLAGEIAGALGWEPNE